MVDAEPEEGCCRDINWARRSAVRFVFFMIAYRINGIKKIRIPYTNHTIVQSKNRPPKTSMIAKWLRFHEHPKISLAH